MKMGGGSESGGVGVWGSVCLLWTCGGVECDGGRRLMMECDGLIL
jgi:hypothetical protein